MEEYRNINGVQVSNLGNVDRGTHIHCGYLEIDNGIHDHVHVLVAKAFPEVCGQWYPGCHVHHKDRNRLNNKAENLIVMSQAEHWCEHVDERTEIRRANNPNNELWYKLAKIKKANGTIHNGKWKHIEQYSKDGEFIAEYASVYEAATKNNVSHETLRRALNGRIKTAGGFKWIGKTQNES